MLDRDLVAYYNNVKRRRHRLAAVVPEEPEPEPVLPFTDSFDRPDENLEASANWAFLEGIPATGGAAVRSNQLAALAGAGQGVTYLCPDQGHKNHYTQFTVRNVTASAGPFVICRVSVGDNFVGVRNSGASLNVFRRIGGAFTSLYSANHAIIVGSSVRFEPEEDDWRLFKDGGLVASGAIGAVLTSTRQGIIARAFVHNPWIDNFEAGLL